MVNVHKSHPLRCLLRPPQRCLSSCLESNRPKVTQLTIHFFTGPFLWPYYVPTVFQVLRVQWQRGNFPALMELTFNGGRWKIISKGISHTRKPNSDARSAISAWWRARKCVAVTLGAQHRILHVRSVFVDHHVFEIRSFSFWILVVVVGFEARAGNISPKAFNLWLPCV